MTISQVLVEFYCAKLTIPKNTYGIGVFLLAPTAACSHD